MFIILAGTRLGHDYQDVPLQDLARDICLPPLQWRRCTFDEGNNVLLQAGKLYYSFIVHEFVQHFLDY